jgi:hypothetical protein
MQQPTPKPMRQWLNNGGKGGRGETKASLLLLLLLLNKFGVSAKTIMMTPLANTQANDRANATTNPRTNAATA